MYKNRSDKVLIFSNGIEIEKFKYNSEIRKMIRRELNIKDNEIVIGHVGRLVKPKNHKYLIKIFKEYNEKNRDSKLLLVGDGNLRKKIEKQVKAYKLEKNVIFMGNRNDTYKMYNAMDVFVFPSLNEGLPLTLIEAQSAGLNIFASNNITDTVNVTGNVKFLDIKEKPKIWAEAILQLREKRKNNSIEKIIESGYDIKDSALKYTKLIKDEMN